MSLKLINCIVNKSKNLSELTKDELWSLHEASITSGDFRALNIATNNVTRIYDYDEKKPYWLLNSFSDPLWCIEIKDNDKTYSRMIDWSGVTLSDGLKLTSTKHQPLLNAFKYWITATDNPRENGGKFRKANTVNLNILLIISIINSILIHGESIQLTEHHLENLSDNFIMALMIKLGEGQSLNGLYDYSNKVRKFLLEKINYITDKEVKDFSKEHPFISRNLLPEEKSLGLTITERIKACFWLNSVGYYRRIIISKRDKTYFVNQPQGNSTVLYSLIYHGNIIFSNNKKISILEELKLISIEKETEFKRIPCIEKNEIMSESSINEYINVFKLLNTVHGRNDVSEFSPEIFNHIKCSRIRQHVKLNSKGRYKTLPTKLVFNLIKSCYEFSCEYQDTILNSILSVLTNGVLKSTKKDSNKTRYPIKNSKNPHYIPTTERGAWSLSGALDLIDNKLKTIGVNRLSIPYTEDGVYEKKRNNKSLFDLYSVLIGSIQILTGVIMAKRIDELITLKSYGNLSPNIDPSSVEGQINDYELIANLKKSGFGGRHGKNVKVKRPIPRSFALMIWKLEQFNQAVTKSGLNKSELSLFNNLNSSTLNLEKISTTTYNNHFNVVCDYFETPLVIFENGEKRRYYIRQHQLRRFFAMVFFWSRSFDGLDTLRWMLGHTDVEHLYRYITESDSGVVLNGVKASYIVDAMDKNKLDNIHELAEALAKRYGIHKENISLSSITDAISDYGDTDEYETTPHIKKLKKQENLESQIYELLEDGIITLEPEFFTVQKNGQKINDFTLTLLVKELD